MRPPHPAQCAARRLSFMAYQVLVPPPQPPSPTTAMLSLSTPVDASNSGGDAASLPPFARRQCESLQWLAGRGFAVSPDVREVSSGGMEAALGEAEKWMRSRALLGGWVGGWVGGWAT